MHRGLMDRIDRVLWGADVVCCEECGEPVRAHVAVWRGARAYCSPDHEQRDQSAVLT